MCEISTPIFKSFKIKNRISLNYPKNINMQSQYLSEDYHDAGQLYWASNKIWNKNLK